MRDRTRPKSQEQAQAIDLTPMLDVVFIMLIFFIVTATFIKVPGIDVDRSDAVTADQRSAAILVAIDPSGDIWMDQKQVQEGDVRMEILRLHTENPKGGVVIQADNEAALEKVGVVADAALDIGITDIAVSTLKE